jgi:hypothetical protein
LVFSLYSSIILLLLLLFDINWLTTICSLILLVIAVYAGKNTHAQTYSLKLSDRGEVELILKNQNRLTGKISKASFYNGLCVYLYIQANPMQLGNLLTSKKNSKKLVVIYKDAVTTEQYRLLARLINTGLY